MQLQSYERVLRPKGVSSNHSPVYANPENRLPMP